MKNKFIILVSLLVINFSFDCFCQAKRVGAIGITVSDMNKAIDFYSKVLSFEKISETEASGANYEKLVGIFGCHSHIVKMKLGDEEIELTDYLTTGGKQIPVDLRSNDLCFQHLAIVVSDMDKAYQQLRTFNVEYVSTAPQTIPVSNKAAAGVKAFYFHDPDNHTLELIYFPLGKGNPKWQKTDNKLFLGIDHTAIGISSTQKSLVFYRDILGLELKGESFNSGTEQEHLNNVEGASLHISGLKASEGPGIEFLEYLKPGPGRMYPHDAKADDLIHWQTTVYVDQFDSIFLKLKNLNYSFISRDKIVFTQPALGFKEAFIVCDPDGHNVLIADNKHDLN